MPRGVVDSEKFAIAILYAYNHTTRRLRAHIVYLLLLARVHACRAGVCCFRVVGSCWLVVNILLCGTVSKGLGQSAANRLRDDKINFRADSDAQSKLVSC